MKIKFLDKIYRAMVVSIVLIAPIESKAENFDSIFWFSYGMGAGISATLCDQVDGGMITNVDAKIFTSNFQESMEDPESTKDFDLEALVQGFNEIVPEFENCKIKLY